MVSNKKCIWWWKWELWCLHHNNNIFFKSLLFDYLEFILMRIKILFKGVDIFTSCYRPCGSYTGVEIKVEGCAAKERYLNWHDLTTRDDYTNVMHKQMLIRRLSIPILNPMQ